MSDLKNAQLKALRVLLANPLMCANISYEVPD